MTVTAGSEVVWVNTTAVTHVLQSGTPADGSRVYLPLVERGVGAGLDGEGRQLGEPQPAAESGAPFQATLGPGGTFTYTFASAGSYPFYLSTPPQFRGLVVVESEAETPTPAGTSTVPAPATAIRPSPSTSALPAG